MWLGLGTSSVLPKLNESCFYNAAQIRSFVGYWNYRNVGIIRNTNLAVMRLFALLLRFCHIYRPSDPKPWAGRLEILVKAASLLDAFHPIAAWRRGNCHRGTDFFKCDTRDTDVLGYLKCGLCPDFEIKRIPFQNANFLHRGLVTGNQIGHNAECPLSSESGLGTPQICGGLGADVPAHLQPPDLLAGDHTTEKLPRCVY